MGTVVLELVPKRELLNPSFDGYKLSLQTLPSTSKNISSVDRSLLDNKHNTLLHTKLFGLHNHLIGETDGSNDSVYYIDSNRNICKTYVDPFVNELIDPIILWQIPKKHDRQPGDYNITLKFIKSNLALVSDGSGYLYILDTGSRNNDDEFKEIFSEEVIGPGKGFVILDAVCKEKENNNEDMHVLLLHLNEYNEHSNVNTVLNWITLNRDNQNIWNQVALRELTAKSIEYAYLETSGEAVYIASDSGAKFTLNSEIPVVEKTEEKVHKYEWSQDLEEVSVKIPISNPQKELLKVTSEPCEVEINYANTTILKGPLFGRIESALTTWSLENGVLEIVFTKHDVGSMWTEFIVGDLSGRYMLNTCIMEGGQNQMGNITNEEENPPSGTTFNSQQIEECDFEFDKAMVFERLSCMTNKVSHKAHLGSNQVLLTVNLRENGPPALGIRHDVDICLWEPQGSGNDFKLCHEATLLALGYVQASKRQKKFIICPPDTSYSIICETSNHLFLYRQEKPIESNELRNRSTGKRIKNVAQQQVVNIGLNEVLGIYCSKERLFLLGNDCIVSYKI